MTLPRPSTREGPTPEGRAGLDALIADPSHALVAADFDGTLAPIVARPQDARPHPGALPALTALAGAVGTVAVITGRPAADAVALGGFGTIPGLIVIGHGRRGLGGGQLAVLPALPAVVAEHDQAGNGLEPAQGDRVRRGPAG
ncbi:MAG TPA: trehalose-phosphatase, partial [Streptosporangiaceae bacterium]|nr:trehalose-phosphatase [Streptosporangiaceae bacterium]